MNNERHKEIIEQLVPLIEEAQSELDAAKAKGLNNMREEKYNQRFRVVSPRFAPDGVHMSIEEAIRHCIESLKITRQYIGRIVVEETWNTAPHQELLKDIFDDPISFLTLATLDSLEKLGVSHDPEEVYDCLSGLTGDDETNNIHLSFLRPNCAMTHIINRDTHPEYWSKP